MNWPLAEPKIRIAPSLLSADFSQLSDEVRAIERAGVEVLHLDVMDGRFAPNLTFGIPVIKSLRPKTKMFFDAHLMIEEPKRYAEAFAEAGCDLLTFHIEATDEPRAVIDHIHSLGVAAGVSLNPTTPVSSIESIMDSVELVLIMSVWPGFSGQKFMPEVLPKLEELRGRLAPYQRLQIDGGIDLNTIGSAVCAGADTLVAGSAVFGKPYPPAAATALRDKAQTVWGAS